VPTFLSPMMTRISAVSRLLLAVCLGSVVFTSTALAQRGTDFALLDQNGRFHQLSRYNQSDAVVLYVYSPDDAVSAAGIPMLLELQQRYAEQGVVFFLLESTRTISRDAAAAALQQQGLDIPMLLDSAQLVARSLGVKTTAEAYVLDPSSFAIVYRGPLDSRIAVAGADPQLPVPYLESALKAALANVEADAPESLPEVAGTALRYEHVERFGDRQISYQDEIVPIVQRRCTVCHVEDGLAPWAMVSHRMMQGWSPMIREVLITRRMPPGQIDTEVGEWGDIHTITDDELMTLVHWIDSGARREGEDDPLATPAPAAPQWALGEPDLVIEVPEEAVPPTGMVDFLIKRADLALPEDRWVQAVAYDVGEPSVLHSLLVHAVDPAISDRNPADLIDPDNADFISLYVPGRPQEVFAPDSGYLLRADRDLSFKLRYVTGGRERLDRTRIGFYFRDTPPQFQVRNVITLNEAFTIAPGADNHVERAAAPVFAEQVFVESFAPQTHTRGKSMRINAELPNGRVLPLINVANYNFNWQMNYPLRERVALPAGSRLVSETVYDNSEANPHNVDPAAQVRVGVTIYDETLHHYARVLERIGN
jgi:peroxiredoxin